MTYLYSIRLIQIETRPLRTPESIGPPVVEARVVRPNSYDMTVLRRPQSPDLGRSSGNNYVGITIGLSFYEKLFVRFKVRLLLPSIVGYFERWKRKNFLILVPRK